MHDVLCLRDNSTPLQERYDRFLLWVNDKNFTSANIIAEELGLDVSEVNVFFELGNLDDDEFAIIDEKGFDMAMVFLIVRSERRGRNEIYSHYEEILNDAQPLRKLMVIADKSSTYNSAVELVKKVNGNCWLSISNYLKQRGIVNGTITSKIRGMLFWAGKAVISGKKLSVDQIAWIIRAIEHDKSKSLGVFTNDTIRLEFNDDYQIFAEIHEILNEYEVNE